MNSLYFQAKNQNEGWIRPTDWLPMPTNITSSNDTFVGLHAVFPEGQNYVAFLFTTSAGQYQVDWGDGTVTLHNSNTLAQYEYNYASISNSTLTSRGYKQAMITVTAVSGLLRTCNFQQRFVTTPAQNQAYATGFLDCVLSMPNANTGISITFGGTTVNHRYLERMDIKTIGSATGGALFANCSYLQELPLFDTSNYQGFGLMFWGCTSIKKIPFFNTQNATGMQQMFQDCYSLQEVPFFNTQNVTTMAFMFANCGNLKKVPLFNTANVNNMSTMFIGCRSLKLIPEFNTSSLTTSNIFADSSNSLTGCKMSFNSTVSFQNCQLSRTALVEIFTNLIDRTSTTSATINITNNWGATALTTAERNIAINKNWVITG
jgi:surface protein